MSVSERMRTDIDYVRQVVERSERPPVPIAIYLLWAAIVLVGFPLVDLAPEHVPAFWTIAGPAGGLLSAFLGWRHSVRIGQQSRREGNRHMAHWAALLLAIFSLVFLSGMGGMGWERTNQIILLLIAFSYFLAGIHLERPLLWVGLLTWAAYFLIFVIPSYEWTVIGVVISAGLVIAGLAGGGKRDAGKE